MIGTGWFSREPVPGRHRLSRPAQPAQGSHNTDRERAQSTRPGCWCFRAPTLIEWHSKAASGEGPAGAPPVRVGRTLLAACGPETTVAENAARGGLPGAASAPLRRPPRPSETETHRLTQAPYHGQPERPARVGSSVSGGQLRRPPVREGRSGSSFSRTLCAVAPRSWRHDRNSCATGPDSHR